MPADIETFAYNLEGGLPWHNLGTALAGRADGEAMRKAAGLDWQVVKQPLYAPVVNGPGQVEVPMKVATLRSTDSKVLGVVGPTYQPIQNDEMFAFADALMQTGETVLFETAGSLSDGKIVFALAAVPERGITIDGDPNGTIAPYLILNTGHDGLRAFQAAFTPVRVVCRNTLNMALAGAGSVYSIRHTVNAETYIEKARRALRLNVEYLGELKAVSEDLIKRPMTVSDVKKATVKLIPSTATDDSKAVKAQAQRDEIVALFQNSANLDGVPESAYRFVQAVAEYADWGRNYRATKRGNAEEARAIAVLDGTAVAIKNRALALVLPKAQPRVGGKFVKAK